MPTTPDNLTLALSRRVAVMQAIAPDLDVSPGSDLYDEIQGDAAGSAQVLYSLANVQNQAYASTATGSFLDQLGADAGLQRIQATFAAITVTVQGASSNVPSGGWIVPQGSIFLTPADANGNTIAFTSNVQTVVASGATAVVACTASVAGTSGNIVANAIVPTTNIPGITILSSTAPVTAAINAETDSAFRGRIMASRTVLYSAAAVAAAATTVPGCVYAYCHDPQDGSGATTTYAAAQDGTLSSPLQTAVQTAVNAVLPLTETSTISAFTLVYAPIAVTIEVASGYDTAATSAAVVAAISAFALTLGQGATMQPGPMWAYVAANVLGLADWYTTSTIPTVAATALFRFLAPPIGTTAVAHGSGGSIPAGLVYLMYTWSSTAGETRATTEVGVATVLNDSITVTAPATFPSGMTHLNIYASTATGTEEFQGFIASTGGATTLVSIATGFSGPPTSGTISAATVTLASV